MYLLMNVPFLIRECLHKGELQLSNIANDKNLVKYLRECMTDMQVHLFLCCYPKQFVVNRHIPE